jgi:hypothetical protein
MCLNEDFGLRAQRALSQVDASVGKLLVLHACCRPYCGGVHASRRAYSHRLPRKRGLCAGEVRVWEVSMSGVSQASAAERGRRARLAGELSAGTEPKSGKGWQGLVNDVEAESYPPLRVDVPSST